jgi:hypothetical protein
MLRPVGIGRPWAALGPLLFVVVHRGFLLIKGINKHKKAARTMNYPACYTTPAAMLPRCEARFKILVSPRRAILRRSMRAYKGEGDRFVSAVLQLLL